ncbi:MAG: glycosyltransferase family 2 protein, partial [Alphaproteobacteria bacterium]|nr:glycosyltransferase family 2 protein [Alphaproteobacteria bacterium]
MSDAVGYVVTVYNKAKFLAGCLDSILGQDDGPPAEIVFVDDGSTDGSGDLLRDLIAARGAAQARVISQKNAGPGPATNRGVREATSP